MKFLYTLTKFLSEFFTATGRVDKEQKMGPPPKTPGIMTSQQLK